MVNKKIYTREKTKAEPSWGKHGKQRSRKLSLSVLSHFLVSPLVRRLILLIFILTVLFWQWSTFISWVNEVVESTLGLFGWGGLALIAAAHIIIAGLVFRQRLSDFVRRWKLYQWNKWLGSTAFFFAVWGILALFDQGGSFGLRIIGGGQGLIGILWVLVLAALGVTIMAPRASFRAVGQSVLWLGKLFKVPFLSTKLGMEEFPPSIRSSALVYRLLLKKLPQRRN